MKELTVSCGNSVLQIRYSMDHAAEICMGIPGRRFDIRMAQQLLNNPNIGTCFPGQGGEGVAAAVGGTGDAQRAPLPAAGERMHHSPG